MRIKEKLYGVRRLIKRLVFAAAVMLLMTGAAVTVQAAVTIRLPDDKTEFEAGKSIKIEINVAGGHSPVAMYAFFRVTNSSNEIVMDTRVSYKFGDGTVSSTFTPDKEGTYLIEVETSSSSELQDFNPMDSKSILVWKNISGSNVTGLADKEYNGQEQTQDIQKFIVMLGEKTLTPETDYVISAYADNVNAGRATMTITGQGFYRGTKDASFTITGMPLPEGAASSVSDTVFSGSEIRLEPTVTVNGTELVKDTDYELSYENNIHVGTATVQIIGKGNYSGEISRTFQIRQASMANAVISSISDTPYTGNPVTPEPTVQYGGKTLIKDTDYTLSYQNNTALGTATVTIKGKGDFKDSVTRTFSIIETQITTSSTLQIRNTDEEICTEFDVGNTVLVCEYTSLYVIADGPYYFYVRISKGGQRLDFREFIITSAGKPRLLFSFVPQEKGDYLVEMTRKDGRQITEAQFVPRWSTVVHVETGRTDISTGTVMGITDKEYTGNAITQNITVILNNKTLKEGTDYYVLYYFNVDIGRAALRIFGIGNYRGRIEQGTTFMILPKTLTADMISLDPANLIYNGKLQKPQITVKNGDFTLDEGTDYTFENAGGTEPGDYQVTITAAENSNYTGTASKAYTISGIPISNAVVTVNPASYVYDGAEKKPAVTVKLNGEVFPAQNYTVTYRNNINAGIAQAVVTAKAGTHYAGTASGSFTIGKYDIASSGVTVGAIADVIYNRGVQTPVPAVTFSGKALQNGTDYTLQYSGNTNAGTAEVTIAGKGNFSGSRKQTFVIKKKEITAAGITIGEIPKQLHTEGNPSQPAVTVKDGNAVLTGEEFTVTYMNNDKPGTASVIIAGKGNYTGSREVTFEILERKDYAEDSLTEIIKEIEEGDTSQYFEEDKKELQEAVAEAKQVLKDGKADAETLEKALAKVEKVKKQADSNLVKYQSADEQQKKDLQEDLALPAVANVEKKILADKKDRDPAGSDFGTLTLRCAKPGKNYIKLKWNKVSGASKYIVYGNTCGKKIKKLKTVKTNQYTQKGLKKDTYHKYVVVAVKDTSVGEKTAATSKMIHVAVAGSKYGNPKSVTVKIKSGKKKKAVTKVTVKKGKKIALYADASPASKKLKVKKHVGIRFESTNTEKAVVSSKGVITGKAKGTCYVFAYAQNGVYKKIKVTVK